MPAVTAPTNASSAAPAAAAVPVRKRHLRTVLLSGIAFVAVYFGGCTASLVRGVMASGELRAPVEERLLADDALREKIGYPFEMTKFSAAGVQVRHVSVSVRFEGVAHGPAGDVRFSGVASSIFGLPLTVRELEWLDADEARRQQAQLQAALFRTGLGALETILPDSRDAGSQ